MWEKFGKKSKRIYFSILHQLQNFMRLRAILNHKGNLYNRTLLFFICRVLFFLLTIQFNKTVDKNPYFLITISFWLIKTFSFIIFWCMCVCCYLIFSDGLRLPIKITTTKYQFAQFVGVHLTSPLPPRARLNPKPNDKNKIVNWF